MNTLAEWRTVIEITEHPGEGTDHYFSARCPVCGAEERSTYWNNGVIAHKGAMAAVIAHLQKEHAEHIAPGGDPPRNTGGPAGSGTRPYAPDHGQPKD
jgi:hypothetical protein